MKRFIGYIILVCSILISVFSGFVPAILSINASADYEYGQNFIYQISTKENSTKNEGDIESGDAIDSIIETFKERLDKANISTYSLETEGKDTIRLSFKAESAINNAVAKYLNFDWGFEAIDFTGKIVLEGKDFFNSGDAFINYDKSIPVIVIPLSNAEDFKTKLYKNVNGSTTEEQSANSETRDGISTFAEGDGDAQTTADKNYIYIVNNWKSEYSLDNIINNSETADTKEKDAYFDRLDATKIEDLFFDYNADKKDATFNQLKYTGFLAEAENDLVLANKLANIVCEQFNSKALDYTVTLLNKDIINTTSNATNPFIELLIYHTGEYGSFKSIVLSTLLIATIIAFVIVSLFLVLNYGLSGLNAIALIPANILITLSVFNSFGAEFNIGTIIALIGIAIVGIFSAGSYFRALKEESYKGKILRKANEEASKKTLMIHVDLSVISILLGLVSYLIPNSIMVSIGATLILGGLFNLILNGIVLRVLSYLLCNSSFINQHLNLLMIEKKKIPDLSKDEKPTYFDAFHKKENKNKSKIFSILGIVLLLASAIGITTFQLTSGNIYNNTSTIIGSKVYLEFQFNENSAIQNESDLTEKVLKNLYVFDLETNKTTDKNIKYEDVLNFTYSYKENYKINKETQKNVYFIVDLKDVYTDDKLVSAYVDSSNKLEGVNLEDAFKYLVTTYNSASNLKEVSLKQITSVKADTNNYYSLLFVAIGSGIVAIYFIFRYGIARGLAALVFVGGGSLVTVGIFALTRVPFNSQITLGTILLTIIGFSIFAYLFNNEKNVKKEAHLSNNDLPARIENSRFSLNLTYSNLIIVIALSTFILISFLFTSSFSTYFIIFIIVGIVLLTAFIHAISFDAVYLMSKGFGRISTIISNYYEDKRIKKMAKKNKPDKGDGPEEAIFIGIND